MEKITKEELLEKLGRIALSDDELEMVTGGTPEEFIQCANNTYAAMIACINQCGNSDDDCEYQCELTAEAAAMGCYGM